MTRTRSGRRFVLPSSTLGALATMALLFPGAPDAAAAEPAVGLATAAPFAVLAGSTVTNTGPSTLNGDLGLFPGTSVTGFGPGGATVNGDRHINDGVAMTAKADLALAYDDAAGRPAGTVLPADLANRVIKPGVHRAPEALGLTGRVTFDAEGDPSAVFIMQVGSAFTSATGSTVALVNGARACNIFWKIGSSATLGSSSVFAGSLLALTSISVQDAVTIQGRALARNGAVTLINDTITVPTCAAAGTGGTTGGGPAGGTTTDAGGTTGGGDGTNGTTGGGGTPGTATTTPATPAAQRAAGVRISRRAGRRGTTRVTVTGQTVRRVVFSRAGRVIGVRRGSPAAVTVPAGGSRILIVRVTYTDGRPPAALRVRLPAPRTPSRAPRTPGGFTG